MSYPKEAMNGASSKETENRPTSPHEQFLTKLHLERINRVLAGEITSEQAAAESAKRELELENRADHDGLTGVLNFQGFVDSVTEDLLLINRYNLPAYMALLDGDKLKAVNDTRGKLTGNELIKTYAAALRQISNQHNTIPILIGRFGGDEFALLMIGGERQEIEQVLEEIRELIPAIAKNSLDLENTVSIGAVSLTDKDSVHTLIERADQNLKEAKQTRNVTVFDNRIISKHILPS